MIWFTVVTWWVNGPAWGFGGEDLSDGRPWHHLDMTARALAGDQRFATVRGDRTRFAGPRPEDRFNRRAAMEVAWHADYIDSYLYNPLWWGEGLLDVGGVTKRKSTRAQAAIRMSDELVKLHFDDLTSTEAIVSAWRRYAQGTVAGLVWAASKNDVAAGQQILGVSVHAVQDFYSHSNWLDDPQRRSMTWLEATLHTRSTGLYSGAYEHDRQPHHGAYSPTCSALPNQRTLAAVFCKGLPAYLSLPICRTLRECSNGQTLPTSVKGIEIRDVVMLEPPGMALDTTWMTPIGGKQRRILDSRGHYLGRSPFLGSHPVAACETVLNLGLACDHDRQTSGNGDLCAVRGNRSVCQPAPGRQGPPDAIDLFVNAKTLAMRNTRQWVELIGQALRERGLEDFWTRLRTQGFARDAVLGRAAAWEDLNRGAHRFLSSGPYPEVQDADGHYLVIDTQTGSARGAGTDADIVAIVEGDQQRAEVLLDILPLRDAKRGPPHPWLAHDDFRPNERATYFLGPFDFVPRRLTLRNDAASVGDVAGAFVEDLGRSLQSAIEGAQQAALAIVGGNPDFVANASVQRLGPDFGTKNRLGVLRFEGGNEGRYTLSYTVKPVASEGLNPAERSAGWTMWEVSLEAFESLAESLVDGVSNSDEPFVFVRVDTVNGRTLAPAGFWGGPYGNFEPPDRRVLRGGRGSRMRVAMAPEGVMVVVGQVWESDQEGEGKREKLWRAFMGTAIAEETDALLDALGKAHEPDWQTKGLEVFGFTRSRRGMWAGPVLATQPGGWLRAGATSPAYRLARWGQIAQTDIVDQVVLPETALVGDVDGNGSDDFVRYEPSDGHWFARSFDGRRLFAKLPWGGEAGDRPLLGDIDGDGTDDLVIYRPETGLWFARQPQGKVIVRRVLWGGQPGDVPMLGDVDGDGKDDFVIYRPARHEWFAKNAQGQRLAARVTWGRLGDVPLVADFDGDGRAEFGMYRPTTGQWFAKRANGSVVFRYRPWGGVAGDQPLACAFGGDVGDDLGILRQQGARSSWWVKSESGQRLLRDAPVPTGRPMVGDVDGDGRCDLVMFDPSDRTWRVRTATRRTSTAPIQWGRPIPKFDPSRSSVQNRASE